MAARTKGKSSFVKQAAILASAGMLVRFLGFVYRLPLTNMLGDEGNGIYGMGYYIYTFLLILSSAGLPAAISKLVSERLALRQYRNAHRVFQTSLIVSASLGTIFAILMALTARQTAALVKTPDSYYCILSLCPTLIIVAIMSVYRGYFQGMNTMVPTAISQIVEQIFNAFFSVYLAYIFLGMFIPEGETENIALGAAGGTMGTGIGALAGLVIVFISYMMIRPYLLRRAKICRQPYEETRTELVKRLMGIAWPIIVGTAVFSMTNLIDIGMVMRILTASGYSETEATVLYGQLSGKYVTLTTLPVAISSSIATAVLPSIAASNRLGERKQVNRKMNLTMRISMIISVPAAVGIGVLGPQIIAMLFQKASDGGILLTVGAISIIFLALCQTATGILQGIGHIRVPVVGALLGAVMKVILNAILIPIPALNIIGAVLSTTGCYLVASIFDVYMLSRITKVRFDFKRILLKPILGSIVMGIAALGVYFGLYHFVPSNTLCTLVAIVLAIVVYGLIMLIIGGIQEEDLQSIPMGGRLIRLSKKLHLM